MEPRGNYIINPLKDLGCGAFGRVEKVEVYNTAGHLSGEYARKVLSVNPVLLNEYFSVEDWKRRFRREVDYQAKCNHDHVVRICIHNLDCEHPWFVMELADTDLRNELRSNVLSDDEKLSALQMVFKGVQYIHSKGLLHRDLKPENILKFDGGCYKISDFGLIKNMDSKAQSDFLSGVLQNKKAGIGTAKYMSDEAKRGVYTQRSDIFALGVIISEMDLGHIDGISALIDKSAAFLPRSRYDSVNEMIDILDEIVATRRGI